MPKVLIVTGDGAEDLEVFYPYQRLLEEGYEVDVGAPTGRSSTLLSFPYGSGGNVRWLAAMDGAAANTFMQLPGVESGGPYPFGKSTMLTDWVLNTYFNFPHNSADVTSVRTETYSP